MSNTLIAPNEPSAPGGTTTTTEKRNNQPPANQGQPADDKKELKPVSKKIEPIRGILKKSREQKEKEEKERLEAEQREKEKRAGLDSEAVLKLLNGDATQEEQGRV